LKDIKHTIASTKKGKVPGITGIVQEIWKNPTIIEELAYFIKATIESVTQLEGPIDYAEQLAFLKTGKIKPIYKDGDKSAITNYRPITVLETIYRLLGDLTQNRMKPFYPRLLHKAQAGFIKGRSIYQNILYTTMSIEQAKKNNQTLYVMLIDLKKAFDKSDRQIIYQTLIAKGFPSQWIEWIKVLAEGIVAYVVLGKSTTELIAFMAGVPQGGQISPFLFNMMIEILINELNIKAKEMNCKMPTPSVWYADDGNILSDNRPLFIALIEVLQLWTTYTNQTVSIEKTKIIVINPPA